MRLAILPVVALLASTLACELPTRNGDGEGSSADPEAGLAPVNVNLPPVPPLEALEVPRSYPDGSYSVAGLFFERESQRNQAIDLTAIVLDVYQCDSAPVGVDGTAGELAAPTEQPTAAVQTGTAGCLLPHLHAVDNLRSTQKLLVVGDLLEQYGAQLRPGNRYTFSGTYALQTRGFTSTEDGLLIVDHIVGENFEAPGSGDGAATGTDVAP
jgi:hypothetical protein